MPVSPIKRMLNFKSSNQFHNACCDHIECYILFCNSSCEVSNGSEHQLEGSRQTIGHSK